MCGVASLSGHRSRGHADEASTSASVGVATHVQTGSEEEEAPHRYALTKANVPAVRKQAGLSKWAIKLGKLLEGYLDYTSNDTMGLDGRCN